MKTVSCILVVAVSIGWALSVNAKPDVLALDQAVFKSATAVAAQSPGSPVKGNNGVGNGVDPAPPGNPKPNDGPGTGPGNPGNKGH